MMDAPMSATTYRPRYHFSPAVGWLNDPNGLVWHDGEYHLFYQWYPRIDVDVSGMCWQHAVSEDLVHWEHLPIALEPDAFGAIWSGSVVVDRANTSGLFDGNGGLVAVFTHHDPASSAERQSLAFSADRGRTWTKYAGNPVLGGADDRDFRDPKVFWHEGSRRWIMVVGVRHRLFASSDLKKWDLLGPTGFSSECPDLFPLRLEGEAACKWVLSLGGRDVVVGEFDGQTFRPETDKLRVDWGMDFYAAQSWDNAPDRRRIWIGWLNNWEYAAKVPDFGARGLMSVPRELALRRTAGGRLVLVQRPIAECTCLRAGVVTGTPEGVDDRDPVGRGDAVEIMATIVPAAGDRCGFRVRASGRNETLIGYDAAEGAVFIDRQRSGNPVTGGRFVAPLPLDGRKLNLRIFVDRCSVEIFCNDGQVVFSSLIFPDFDSQALQWFSESGKSGVEQMTVYRMAGIQQGASR